MVSICILSDDGCLYKAAGIVGEGGVIVYPTDTVYGMGGDPFNINTVSRIFHLKRRVKMPFPILISSLDYVYRIIYRNRLIDDLARRYWPGGLTIVAPARVDIPAIFGSKYVGVRIPGHDRLRVLIGMAGGYLVGTSANISGYPPSRSLGEAINYFGEDVDLYIDGGILGGRPSTVVEVGMDYIRVLRRGLLDVRDIELYCRELGVDFYG